ILFRKKKCICGLNTDLIIEQIIGRTDDLLISIDGNAIPGVNIYSIFKKYSSMIRQFRLNQTSGAILNVEIVPTKYFLNSIKEEIINDLKLRLGKDMQIIIHFEKKIKRGSNNKIRVINRNFEEDTFV
ncbi:hypothetical protein HN836_03725, partial [Candidatus Woesearchaeota archaeon]|nr:hypothetical protein [Candidatus Woesearchaeota archaeon]